MVGYVSAGKAAQMLGVSYSTLRRWDAEGKLVAERTPANRRRYKVSDVASRPLICQATRQQHQVNSLNQELSIKLCVSTFE